MTPKFLRLAALALAAAAHLAATPLTVTTAVHTQPDGTSAALTYLKAGTEPAASAKATAPAGWLAIDLPGPFVGYVENKDLAKSLDVKPGASIRLAPKSDAGVLAVADAADKTTLTGLHGKWTQISLEKNLVGYIRVEAAGAGQPAMATTPAAPADTSATPGQPAPSLNSGGDSSALPRQFAGKFVSTRRPLAPRRPYDYALNDDAGQRYAYLDISKLLLTEQIENYVGRSVMVFGTAKNAPDGKEIVIMIETLQLAPAKRP
ncbi:MAG: hypothetical protein ABIQ12_04545 [Opitutaceae bacterium]